MIHSEYGLNVEGVQKGRMLGYASKSDYIHSSITSGKSVHMTVPGQGDIFHSVSVKGSYFKLVTKVNGSRGISIAHRIFDPAKTNPYYLSASHINKNAVTVFSIWK